jgi:hypothetical protein
MKRFWHSRLIRHSRLVTPPTWAVCTFVAFLLLFEWLAGVPLRGQLAVQPPELGFPAVLLIGLGTFVFGIYRVAAFNPYFRPAYREWLRLTAWRSPQPLPLGPITLTLADLGLLLLAAGLLWVRHPGISPFRIAVIFSAAYLLCLALGLQNSGPRGFGYAVIFGLGGVFMSVPDLLLESGILIATYLVAWGGLRLALIKLREIDAGAIERHLVMPTTTPLRSAEISPLFVGWPFGYLGPKRHVPHLSTFDAVCLSLLGGWSLASAMRFISYVQEPGPQTAENLRLLVVMSFGGASLLIFGRMLGCAVHHRPPISLLGRLATLRLIIPTYDRAFVAPFASLVLLWSLAPRMLANPGPPSILAMSSLLTAALLIGLVPGPSFRDWSLTCDCRIAPAKVPERPAK